ncbi:MAG: phage terminase small subunit P27 family [Methylacidiphilales bacterium]|nr:phage terminase small subunit P27 family [Candidatus Methylacidiphilales bacterium]
MNPAAPIPNPDLPVPPEWLSARGAEIFSGLVGIISDMGIASASDTAALAMLASRLEEVEICTAIIEDAGRTYTTNSESGVLHRPRPEVTQRSEAMRHAQSLLAEFGLTPAARAKVSVAKQPEQNPFKALLG